MAEAVSLRERKKQKTRNRILTVSARLFAQQGYVATTLGQIASAADISVPTLLTYFSSKDRLVTSTEWSLVENLRAASRTPNATPTPSRSGAVTSTSTPPTPRTTGTCSSPPCASPSTPPSYARPCSRSAPRSRTPSPPASPPTSDPTRSNSSDLAHPNHPRPRQPRRAAAMDRQRRQRGPTRRDTGGHRPRRNHPRTTTNTTTNNHQVASEDLTEPPTGFVAGPVRNFV